MSLTKLIVSLIILELTLSFCVAESDSNCSQDNDHCESDSECSEAHLSFDELLEQLENGTQIKFCSGRTIPLKTQFNFTRLHNITMTSSNVTFDRAVITCTVRNAGLIFTECFNITITNINITGCGLQYHHSFEQQNSTLVLQSSIHIANSTHTHFENVHIANSNGTGMIFLDTIGDVGILNCTFENNTLDLTNNERPGNFYYAGGGGIYIELMSNRTPSNKNHTENETSLYKVEYCLFRNNLANVSDHEIQTPRVAGLGNGLGRGGGLSIAIKDAANFNVIKVNETKFLNNLALSAGGLNVFYQGSTYNNTVQVTHSNFSENKCTLKYKGGGGVYTGCLFVNNRLPRCNKITFSNCCFVGNQATFGGGTALYSSRSDSRDLEKTNAFTFINCTWERNKAKYGSAVTVLPQNEDIFKSGFTPIPVFDNCTFVSNYVIESVKSISQHYTYSSRGKGAFLVSTFTVEFKRRTNFSENNGSAMYLTQGIVKFARGSATTFLKNTGFQGGAIALFGFSALYVRDNCTVTFENNTAISRGGAIYFLSFDKQSYLHSQSCFIQYEGNQYNSQRRNLSFSFKGNRAMIGGELPLFDQKMHFGHSIYATTLIPCQNNCNQSTTSEKYACLNSRHNASKMYRDPFSCIGNFVYHDNRCVLDEVATSGKEFCPLVKNNARLLQIIPGKETLVPITIQDDLQQSVWAIHRISINNTKHTESQVSVAPLHVYSYENIIKLNGRPDDLTQVQIATTATRDIVVSIEVEMQQCPPGFVINVTGTVTTCVCSASTMNKRYIGINKCDEIQFRAYLHRGYWIGYVGGENGTKEELLSTKCPRDYCLHYRSVRYVSTEYKLPNTSSKRELDQFICGPNRTGILCGSCSENYSVAYHPNSYRCASNMHCEWGIIFYTITELLPVSILFVLVIVFNISFTSGAINGIIFYAQIIDTMEISGRNTIFISKPLHMATRAYRLIYRTFNLNFFALPEMSFCLWEGAGTLDIIAFKYVTICYILLLVIITVAIIHLCNHTSRCQKRTFTGCKYRCTYKTNVRSSIVHGLSAFLVMCYTQCTRVSFTLLTYGNLRSNAPRDNIVRRVVFFDGESNYLEGKHLKYALPAMFFTTVMVTIPPILLIIYPLCHWVFAILRIEESRFLQVTCKLIPLDKLKPLFDSFQGPFKDRYRFFAGMYYIYRLVALAGFTFSGSATNLYSILAILLICMLALHSIFQPYKQHWHNILDTLIFCNLAIVNGLTFYNYKRTTDRRKYDQEINKTAAFQIFLVFLPLGYIVLYTMMLIILKLKRYYRKKCMSAVVCEEEEEYHWMLMADNRDCENSDIFADSNTAN